MNNKQPKITVTISADYTEFEPDTMKGFIVRIGDKESRFTTIDEAEDYAADHCHNYSVMASVDHYFMDRNEAQSAPTTPKP